MKGLRDTVQELAEPTVESLAPRFADRLVVFALRRLGERAAAEDAAQETLRRVIEAFEQKRIRDLEALPGFVFQTAKHVCHQMLRRRGREQRALERLANESTVVLTSVLDELVSDERGRAVRRALEQLSREDRELLELYYAHGLDADEIAGRAGIKASTTRVRKHRALQRLSKLLNEDETFRPLQELKEP